MKAIIRNHNGRITVEVDCPDSKALVANIGAVQEVLDAATHCGKCKSPALVYRKRTNKDFEFYELHCKGCGADLRFGVRKGSEQLYPKRYDEDGHALPDYGWERYEREPQA